MIIGKRISDRYKILDILGGGGMANVYLAHDMILDRDVAVKMLRLDFADDEEFIRRFHREAQSATSLAHPNIVNIYDVGEEDDLYYIVLEYVEGQTLKQYIQQNSPIRVEKVVEIMKQLTSAISHAHQNHIIHRDIKPHNILIDLNGNVKITDFGIAMALSATSITQTNSVLGSVHYLSPEQARGGMATRKSDIYSLGIVMFELLTGRLPFSGESAVSIALKHLQSETPSVRRWNPTVPQSVENIVLKATAKDPFNRYNNVDEMEEDLRTALDPERLHEPKFTIPDDDEATKAIPVITDDHINKNLDETLVHSNDKNNNDKKSSPKKEKTKPKPKRKKWPIVLVSTFILLVILAILTLFVFPGLFSVKNVKIPDVSGMSVDDAISKLKLKGVQPGKKIEMSDDTVKKDHIIKTDPVAGNIVKENTKINLYVSSGKEKVEISDYVGRLYDDVFPLLVNQNFKDIKKQEVNDDSDPGTIISQNPAGGQNIVPQDTVLEFKVSKGPTKIVLKDLTQYSVKSAQDYVASVGLTLDTSQQQYSDTIPTGNVISQTPAAGTEMKKGDQVSVIISKGKQDFPPKEVIQDITIPYDPTAAAANPDHKQLVQIYIDDMNHTMTNPADTFYITDNKKYQIKLLIPYGKKAGYRVQVDQKVVMDETKNYSDS